MPATLLTAALAALLIAQSTSLAPPEVISGPERPTTSAAQELAAGVALGGFVTSTGALMLLTDAWFKPPGEVAFAFWLGLPAWAAGTTFMLTHDLDAFGLVHDEQPVGMRPSLSQAMSGAMVWSTLSATLPVLDQDPPPALPFVLSPTLGLGLGAVGHWLLSPSSGQVSAWSSGGLLGTSAALVYSLSGTLEPFSLENVAVIHAGLLAGGALAWAYPRPRRVVVVSDAVGLLSGLLVFAFTAGGREEVPTTASVSASTTQIAAFLIAYFLLEDDLALLSDASPVQLHLTTGDALFHAPGERQGGAGVMLSLPW